MGHSVGLGSWVLVPCPVCPRGWLCRAGGRARAEPTKDPSPRSAPLGEHRRAAGLHELLTSKAQQPCQGEELPGLQELPRSCLFLIV